MSNVQHYFEQLVHSLEEEQIYDRQQYEDTINYASTSDRKNKGITWFPIAIQDSEIGIGDYLTLHVSRTNGLDEPHQFRFGMPVSLFSNHNPAVDRINGTISYVNNKMMKVSLRLDELPDWMRNGKLGVDLLFDENSYKEMFLALKKAVDSDNALVRLLSHENPLAEASSTIPFEKLSLNNQQNKAVAKILNNQDLVIVHGPPGTGKTSTLVQAISALYKQEGQQLLVVAPSNTAVDVLTERLDLQGLKVLRIGNPVKVSESLQKLTFDGQINQHPESKEIRKLKKQASAYTDMAHKYKRSFGKAEREQRKALFKEAHKVMDQVQQIQDFISSSILNQAEVITATLVGANQFQIRNRNYHTVFIDEAGQALEPACWIPIVKSPRIVLAGDHLQLPPTIKSPGKEALKLKQTLLEKLVTQHPERVVLLQEQYRMHQDIMQFPSDQLYQGQLIANEQVKNRKLFEAEEAIQFIDTAGAGYEETQLEHAIFNTEEAHFTLNYLYQYCQRLRTSFTLENFPSIGIISPYRKQVHTLQQYAQEHLGLQDYMAYIQINTIDSFQGQEKDLILISLARSNDRQEIGFLAEERRMNVAITRAKKQLIIIGDSSTISKNKFYNDLITYCEAGNGYHSIYEYSL